MDLLIITSTRSTTQHALGCILILCLCSSWFKLSSSIHIDRFSSGISATTPSVLCTGPPRIIFNMFKYITLFSIPNFSLISPLTKEKAHLQMMSFVVPFMMWPFLPCLVIIIFHKIVQCSSSVALHIFSFH